MPWMVRQRGAMLLCLLCLADGSKHLSKALGPTKSHLHSREVGTEAQLAALDPPALPTQAPNATAALLPTAQAHSPSQNATDAPPAPIAREAPPPAPNPRARLKPQDGHFKVLPGKVLRGSNESSAGERAPQRAGAASPGPTRADLVVVVPTATHRHELVRASSAWRREIRTLVASNGTREPAASSTGTREAFNCTGAAPKSLWEVFNGTREGRESPAEEMWAVYADCHDKGYTPGDARMLAAVRLANESFWDQGYKWLVFGDDDMFVFVGNLLRLLQGLDPDTPYILSDDVHNCCHHHCKSPPVACLLPSQQPLLGTIQDTDAGSSEDIPCVWQPAEAPCKVDRLMANASNLCTLSTRNGFFNGGRGAVISRGMMAAIRRDHWLRCEANLTAGGGDHRVSTCIWEAGYGISSPTRDLTGHKHKLKCGFGAMPGHQIIAEYEDVKHAQCCRHNDICMHSVYGVITAAFVVHHKAAGAPLLHQMEKLSQLESQVTALAPQLCPRPQKQYSVIRTVVKHRQSNLYG